MCVLAIQTVRELISVRLADNMRTGVDKTLYRWSRYCSSVMRPKPIRIAETRLVAGDIVKILDAAAQASERAISTRRNLDMRVTAESADRVACKYVFQDCIVL